MKNASRLLEHVSKGLALFKCYIALKAAPSTPMQHRIRLAKFHMSSAWPTWDMCGLWPMFFTDSSGCSARVNEGQVKLKKKKLIPEFLSTERKSLTIQVLVQPQAHLHIRVVQM
jgi:hypothetical protein